MKNTRWLTLALALTFTFLMASRAEADDLADLVVNLLADPDKELRGLGLEQVRSELPGVEATKLFASQLPKLAPDAQVGLLSALADRGDAAARPAVVELLEATDSEPTRIEAIRALGLLGELEDVKRLTGYLTTGSVEQRAAARLSLVRLRGKRVPVAIAKALDGAAVPLRVVLLEVLAERRAIDTISEMHVAALDEEPTVRTAAMAALGQLASPEHLPDMVKGVLRADEGAERAAAEKAIMFVCLRIENPGERDQPLLAAIHGLKPEDQTALLPTLGRVGGRAAIQVIETALNDTDPAQHDAGVRGLCNWPDASVAPRLAELAQADDHEKHRALARAALIRVAPLPDGRSDEERLALIQSVLPLCKSDAESNLLLKRASAVRTIATLRFLLPFLDKPPHAEQVCESIVELAHHRGLREPNKAEFDQALDRVLQTSRDAVVLDRANRYKKGQTWVRPK